MRSSRAPTPPATAGARIRDSQTRGTLVISARDSLSPRARVPRPDKATTRADVQMSLLPSGARGTTHARRLRQDDWSPPGDLLRGTWQLGPPRSDTTTRARIDAQDERNYRAQGGHDVLGVLRRGGARAGKDGRCVDPTTLARVLSSRVSGIPEEGSELRRHPRTRPLARSLARPPPRDLVHLVDIPVS